MNNFEVIREYIRSIGMLESNFDDFISISGDLYVFKTTFYDKVEDI
jgi:hypothetical protein